VVNSSTLSECIEKYMKRTSLLVKDLSFVGYEIEEVDWVDVHNEAKNIIKNKAQYDCIIADY
jgi:hypothetical protein